MDTRGRVLVAGGVAAATLAGGVVLARRRSAHDEQATTTSRYLGPVTRVADELFDVPDDVQDGFVSSVDGARLHYLERGSGPPLVLLHGITLRADVWAPQLNLMADRYRVVAVDLRGHGRSTAGAEGFGIDCLADDAAAVLDGLDLRDAIVVGHSMGGMGLMQMCGRHPDVLGARVAGLVFMATRAHQVVPPYLRAAAARLTERQQAAVDAGRGRPAAQSFGDRLARPAFGDRPSRRAMAIVAEMGGSMDPTAMLTSARGLLDHDARVGLQATHTPSLVLVGSRDLLTPVASARHLAGLLPDSRLVIYPRAGHQLMQERPQGVAEVIDEFAERLGTPADGSPVAEPVGPDAG